MFQSRLLIPVVWCLRIVASKDIPSVLVANNAFHIRTVLIDPSLQNTYRILHALRGGDDDGESDYDDEYDDEKLSDADGDEPPPPRRFGEVPDQQRNPYDHRMAAPQRRPYPPPYQKRKKSNPLQQFASKSLQLTSGLAWSTVKQTGQAAYHLVKPKYVDIRELAGLWRLDQQITERGDRILASVATVQLDPSQRLVIMEDGGERKIREPFVFKRTRLGSFKTEFIAPAFLVGDKPRLYGYRGTWQRKMADKRVIKLVGKIYSVRKQRFGRGKGSYQFVQPVGTFVARRRVEIAEVDDYGDDEYENEDVEDDDWESDVDADATAYSEDDIDEQQ